MTDRCTIAGCPQEQWEEGVCLWHYPLWEMWGYEHDGYMVYMEHGRIAGRKAFKAYLENMRHQDIIDILSGYDWNLTLAVNESIRKGVTEVEDEQ